MTREIPETGPSEHRTLMTAYRRFPSTISSMIPIDLTYDLSMTNVKHIYGLFYKVLPSRRGIDRGICRTFGMKISEVIRKLTIEAIEDEIDIEAYRKAKARFDENPVSYSHEDVGRRLGFL